MSVEVPKGWREVRIGQIAREISNRNHASADIPVLSMTSTGVLSVPMSISQSPFIVRTPANTRL